MTQVEYTETNLGIKVNFVGIRYDLPVGRALQYMGKQDDWVYKSELEAGSELCSDNVEETVSSLIRAKLIDVDRRGVNNTVVRVKLADDTEDVMKAFARKYIDYIERPIIQGARDAFGNLSCSLEHEPIAQLNDLAKILRAREHLSTERYEKILRPIDIRRLPSLIENVKEIMPETANDFLDAILHEESLAVQRGIDSWIQRSYRNGDAVFLARGVASGIYGLISEFYPDDKEMLQTTIKMAIDAKLLDQ